MTLPAQAWVCACPEVLRGVPVVEFRILGGLNLLGADGRELTSVLAQPKRVALLAYLAAATPRRLHRRDSLVALFWPELDQEHARAALRQALHGLRHALGDGVFMTRGDEDIGLYQEQIRCDVGEFEGAAEAGRLADALDLYRGDLLDGFFIRGAPEFEQWLEDERARLKAVALRSATQLAERSEGQGGLAEAAQWSRRALRIAPLDEPALRRLMKTLDRLGDRAGALDAYEAFAKRLTAELEAEPAPETRSLADAVRTRAATLSSAVTALSPLETRPSPPQAGPARRRWVGAAAGLLGLAVVVAAVSLRAREPAPLDPKRVLVVPFANRTGDSTLDPLGNLAADWITRGLDLTGVLELADPGAMVLGGRTVSANRPAQKGHEDADARRALALASGSGLAVLGSMYRHDDGIEFHAQITDEVRGRILHTLDPVLGDPREPRPALTLLRDRIMAALAAAVDPRLGALASGAGQPPRYDAYLAFTAGVEIFYGGRRARDALPYLLRAAALDSTYALPLIWAAWAHAGTALDQCDSTAAIAERLTAMRLTSLEQMQIDRVMARCRGDLAAAYALGSRLGEAVTILERLHPDSGALSGRAGYYNWLTNAYHVLGQHDRELEAAQRARRRFPRNLATLRMELLALAALRRGREVNERFDEIEALPPDPIRLPAPVMREIALDLAAHGETAAARVALGRTLAWHASRPRAEQAQEPMRFERAETYYAAGYADSARAIAADLARAHPQNEQYAGLLGVLAAQRGDRADAARLDRLLVALERPLGRGQATYWRSCIAALLGQRDAAVDLLARALDAGYVYQVRFLNVHVEPSFRTLREYPRFQKLMAPKG